MLATDALIADGGELAELSPATLRGAQRAAAAALEPRQPDRHPGRRRAPERYAKALEIAATDPNSDGLLVILTPQAMTDPTRDGRGAEALRQATAASRCWRAGWAAPTSRPARRSSTQANIPTFPYPDTAARIFTYMWRYSDNLRALYETPTLPRRLERDAIGRARAADIIDDGRGPRAARC